MWPNPQFAGFFLCSVISSLTEADLHQCKKFSVTHQRAITCSKLTIETPEQDVKYV